jgi:hypothetical protein
MLMQMQQKEFDPSTPLILLRKFYIFLHAELLMNSTRTEKKVLRNKERLLSLMNLANDDCELLLHFIFLDMREKYCIPFDEPTILNGESDMWIYSFLPSILFDIVQLWIYNLIRADDLRAYSLIQTCKNFFDALERPLCDTTSDSLSCETQCYNQFTRTYRMFMNRVFHYEYFLTRIGDIPLQVNLDQMFLPRIFFRGVYF